MFTKFSLMALAAGAALGLTLATAEAGPINKNIFKAHTTLHPIKLPAKPGPHFKGPMFHHHHAHVRAYFRPVYAGYPVVAGPRVVSAPVRACLSKEYTPEGAVLFRDNCTNEWAMNPPPAAPELTQ